ncbi:hypothetical protein [Kibdelosporangium philippinense]|uniref:hypothetical protein n=1 Tax=Kibdelosporangium philippinense TaxID=211113 RepID=UPI003620DF4C
MSDSRFERPPGIRPRRLDGPVRPSIDHRGRGQTSNSDREVGGVLEVILTDSGRDPVIVGVVG